MKVATVILAAGESRRFDGIKQLAPVGDRAMVEVVLANYAEVFGGSSGMNLVLGANAEPIEQLMLEHFGGQIEVLRVEHWKRGMGYSLAQAVVNLNSQVTHVLIGLADQIAITSACIQSLVDTCHEHPKKIVVSSYEGTQGVPAIFPKKYFSQLISLKGDQGAKQLLKECLDDQVAVELPNAAIDIDTREDLRIWMKHTK